MILSIALGILLAGFAFAVAYVILASLLKADLDDFRIEMRKESIKNELAFQVAREKHLKNDR